jgi:hypothetical protein
MKASRIHRLRAVSLLVFGSLALPVSSPRADTPSETGDLWEVISQMSMEGMPMAMPAQKMKVCAAKDWERPPGGDSSERGCTSSDMVVDEDSGTVTWTSVCADGMTGTGRIVRDGDDAYEGEIRYASDDGDIVIKLNGRRLGECDNPQ